MDDVAATAAHLDAGAPEPLGPSHPERHGVQPRDLITRSDLRGALALAVDYGAIIGAAVLAEHVGHWAVTLLAVLVIGTLQYAIREALLHEAVHHNLFKTRWLNEWSRVLTAWPFFYDFEEYRQGHFAHHRDPMGEHDSIPDAYHQAGYHGRRRGMWWVWLVRPALGYGALTYLVQFIKPSLFQAATLGVMTGVAWLAAGSTGLGWLVVYWFAPLLLVSACHDHWFGVADHLHTKRSLSRSNVSWWWNALHHGLGYHTVHHLYPAIPWFNLRKAHRLFCPEGTDVTTSLWDTYRQVSCVDGARPLRGARPVAPPLAQVLAVLNWYPGEERNRGQ